MNLFFDHQAFSYQDYGGVSRYFAELISRFRSLSDVSCYLSLKYTNNAYLSSSVFGEKSFLKDFSFKGRRFLMSWLNRRESERNLQERSWDVFHPTYYDPYFLKFLGSRPFVLTVFDMIHEIYPRYFCDNDHTAAYKKLLVPRANRIIAISESTKQDIIRFFGVDPAKVDVVHLAASFAHVNSDRVHLSRLPFKYVLYVGNRGGYKNFDVLVKVFSRFFKDKSDLHLVCCGGGVFNARETDLFQSKGLAGRIHYFSGRDEVMYALYHKAETFIFPSLYEGFGIPVLEAFLCGCPVILSHSSSLPEVGGQAAVYFDPLDEESLVSAMKNVLFNESKRKDMIQKGMEQIRKFSWEKTVSQTRAVYEKVVVS